MSYKWHWQLSIKYDSSQPRAPAGDPRGGQWVEIASGPFNFIVRLTLEDAKLPPSHMDGISKIDFVEGDYAGGGNAYGTYSPRTGTIMLASNAPESRVYGGNIATYGGATILHEIGHNVHLAKLTPEAAKEWQDYSRKGQSARISAYAQTNAGEHFAECYRQYARGGDYRKKLKSLEPLAYKFLQPLFSSRGEKNFLPEGQRAGEEEQWTRYNGEL